MLCWRMDYWHCWQRTRTDNVLLYDKYLHIYIRNFRCSHKNFISLHCFLTVKTIEHFIDICWHFQVLATWHCGWPVKRETFSHVSRETEETRCLLLLVDKRCHGSRAVHGIELRLQVKYFHLSFLGPYCSQRLLPTLGNLEDGKRVLDVRDWGVVQTASQIRFLAQQDWN